ncbi:hypothetical protein GEV33_008734 [Tenebrio molitor]|uniref:Uncharacterized protein n=1 Tax=Tenebrio molitor TaxID=7067 RepID=A0A8J6LBB2_TENMO|nr:hypothetical protein GEV33_008734 [Tenebrio molitor]
MKKRGGFSVEGGIWDGENGDNGNGTIIGGNVGGVIENFVRFEVEDKALMWFQQDGATVHTVGSLKANFRTLRSAFFFSFFLCGAAGLRGTFPGYPRPPSLLLPPFSGRHNTNTNTNIHGRPIRPGIRTLLTSRWCRKSVALPSTTLPSAPERHTHTSMARRRFLPWKKSSPFAEEAAGIVPLSSQFQRGGSYIPSGLSGREPWPFARKISLFPIFFFLHGLEFIGVDVFLWIAPIFGIFTKSPVPVRRVAWFFVSCWIAYLLEPQLYRNFRILGVTDFFLAFRRPKKKKTSRRLRSFKRISYEDLLPDPFQRIRRVSCFSGLLFFISTGISSGLNGSRTTEPRTPQDAEGRRRRLRSDRSRISYRAYRNRASILLVPDTSSDACPPPQLALNGTETEQGEIRIRKDYTHIREVKFSGSIGPLGEKRLCKIKCIGGQWVGPLCVDNHDNGRFHPLFRSCKLEYINPHLVVTFRNVSIHNGEWVPM